MSGRHLLWTCGGLFAVVAAYCIGRYGVHGASDVAGVAVEAVPLVLLLRGSRGAWLACFATAGAGTVYASVLASRGAADAETLLFAAAYAGQAAILLHPRVRTFVQERAQLRAIAAHRSW